MSVDDGNFDEVMRRKQIAYGRGVRLGLGEIVNEIKARADELVPIAPVAGTTLQGSQSVRVRERGTQVTAEIGYGGPASAYALVQHEDLTLSHPPKALGGSPVAPGQGRGPKYLEYPTKQIAKRAEKIIAQAIRQAGG